MARNEPGPGPKAKAVAISGVKYTVPISAVSLSDYWPWLTCGEGLPSEAVDLGQPINAKSATTAATAATIQKDRFLPW